jgi:hypothetical protein
LYRKICRDLQFLVKQKKKTSFQEYSESLVKLDTNVLLKKFKGMKRSRFGQSQCTKLSADPDSLTGYSQHSLDTYTSVKMHRDTYSYPSPLSDDIDNSIAVFTEPRIVQNIKYLAYGKAPGEDGIIAELLKPIGDKVAKFLSMFFLWLYNSGVTTSLWRLATVVPVYKDKGARVDIARYRPISLISLLRRIFERCLTPTFRSAVAPLDVAQGGFRSNRSTTEQVVALDYMMKFPKKKGSH